MQKEFQERNFEPSPIVADMNGDANIPATDAAVATDTPELNTHYKYYSNCTLRISVVSATIRTYLL